MACSLHDASHGHSHHGHSHGSGGGLNGIFKKENKSQSNAPLIPETEEDGGENRHIVTLEASNSSSDGIPKENINVRAAFIHVIGDFIQSIGILIASYIIYYKVKKFLFFHLSFRIIT